MKSNFSIPAQGEVLILPDGKILAHNITPELATVLTELDPDNDLMRKRARKSAFDELRLVFQTRRAPTKKI